MLRSLLLTLITLLAAAQSPGQTLEVRPGEIAAGMELPVRESTLTLTGSLDASDLDRLAGTLDGVGLLDLSGVRIESYNGARIGANITSAPADVLPDGILAGLRVSRLILPATLVSIGEGALMDSHITEITIPDRVTTVGRCAFAFCKNLRSLSLGKSVTLVPGRMAEGCEALTSVELPEGISTIGDRAFFGCRSLSSLAMPSALMTIGEETFATSGLESADLSKCKALTEIGARTLASCRSLSTVTLPDGASTMGEGVFFDCTSLTSVRLPASAVTIPPLTLTGATALTTFTIPKGVESIDTLAFAGMTGLETLILPPALDYIADAAFEGNTALRYLDAGAVSTVPALGEDVWAGVNQPEVGLGVPQSLENSFRTTPQWQDFAISMSGLTAPGTDADTGVTAAFEGRFLTVISTAPLARIELYTTDGRLVTLIDYPDDLTTVIDTGDHPGHFFIVRTIALADDAVYTFKLLRQ